MATTLTSFALPFSSEIPIKAPLRWWAATTEAAPNLALAVILCASPTVYLVPILEQMATRERDPLV
jgi:hypothetical protein